ncbi:Pre-mRNA-splicing factor, partial [Aphelenchoides avenae]
EDVEYCYYELDQSTLPLKVLPLYGSLPSELQQEVLKRVLTGYRQVVVATNITETSIKRHRLRDRPRLHEADVRSRRPPLPGDASVRLLQDKL